MTLRPSLLPARWRRTLCSLAVLGVVVSGIGLASEVTQALPAGTPAFGTMRLNPPTGDSSTTFTLAFDTPTAPQVCPGDNTANYLWHTFIIPASADPADMTFTNSGTPNNKPAFSNNLANSIATRSRNNTPGLGDGLVVEPRNLTFSNAFYAPLSAGGDYWVGIACTLPDFAAGTVNTAKFWAGRLTITPAAGAGPNNFTYAMATTQDTTTTSTTTTTTTTVPTGGGSTTSTTTVAPTGSSTTVASTTTTTNPCPSTTTSTTLAGATTTTIAGATTTTNPCVTTTTTGVAGQAGTTSTTVRVGSGSGSLQVGGTGAGTGSTLADTGTSSSTPMIVFWAVLLLLFGRMVILMARPVRVVDERR